MPTFQSYKKIVAAFGICVALGSGVLTASAAQSLASSTVSVERTAGGIVARIDEWLQTHKTELEQEIAALQQDENSTKQTTVGQQITQTTGVAVLPHSTGTADQTLMRLWKQLLLMAVDVGIFIVEHTWLLYTVAAILAIVIIKFILRLIF